MESGFEFRSGLFVFCLSVTTLLWRLSCESRRRWKVSGSWRGKKVKIFWSFPAQPGKHGCSYQVIEVSAWCCLEGWMNLFPLACTWWLSERHNRSFQVKKLSGRQGRSSLEATLLHAKSMSLRSCYGTASDIVWYSHKRGICHLTGLRLWDCGDSLQLCCTNICKLGSPGVFSFITKSLSPWGLLCPLTFVSDHSCSWWIWSADLDHLPNVGNKECCSCLHFYL